MLTYADIQDLREQERANAAMQSNVKALLGESSVGIGTQFTCITGTKEQILTLLLF
jgi:hypothetical protein